MRSNGTIPASLYTPAGNRKYLTSAERTRFIAAAALCPRPEIKTLCLTLAHTGCRISEALSLQGLSVEPQAGFIAIRCLKKRSRAAIVREVPVPQALLDTLASVHGLCPWDQASRLWRLSRSRAWQLVKGVMRDAGIPPGIHATPKGLRHAFGLHAVQCGIPLNLVQRWLGHAAMTTTAIYLQAMGREERALAARMWE